MLRAGFEAAPGGASESNVDLLIRGGTIVDGTGAPRRVADIAIEGDRIVEVGTNVEVGETRVIDAAGLIVSPGFIDTHAHSDGALLLDPQHENGIRQGITTEIITQDGMGFAPLASGQYAEYRRYLSGILGLPDPDLDMSTIAALRGHYEGVASNVAVLVPHGALRLAVAGFRDVPLEGPLLADAKKLLSEGLADGAVGLSTGLSYYPQSYSDTDELAALCEVVAEAGGVYVTHVRNHNNDRADGGSGVGEALEVGRRTGVKVHVSHFRTSVPTAGETAELMTPVDEAKARGVDVTLECYPYPVGSTVPGYFLPGVLHEGGPDRILERLADETERDEVIEAFRTLFPGAMATAAWTHLGSPANAHLEGLAFTDAAALRGVSIEEMVADVMLEERLTCGFRYIPTGSVASWQQVDEDVMTLLDRDDYMIGSDAIPHGRFPHPRAWGCFPRVVGRLRRRSGRPLEQVIQRVTQLPASRFALDGRGVIAPGAFADLVVFDEDGIVDLATFEDPRLPPAGIPYVVVNGQVAVESGQVTGVLAGRPVPER
jgi:N-acyl-D-amino-acid deacylase